jgi:hypothetical protein
MMSSFPAFLSSFTVSFSGSRAEGKCGDRVMMHYAVNGYRPVHNFSLPRQRSRARVHFFFLTGKKTLPSYKILAANVPLV